MRVLWYWMPAVLLIDTTHVACHGCALLSSAPRRTFATQTGVSRGALSKSVAVNLKDTTKILNKRRLHVVKMKTVDIIKLLVSIYCRAVVDRVRVFSLHDQFNLHLVCVAKQAVVQPSKRCVRSGLDGLISIDGRCVVPCMAVSAKSHARHRNRPFCGTACSQRHVDVCVFRIAKHTLRRAYHYPSVDFDCRDDLPVLQG